MKWLELSVETPQEFVEPLSEIFHQYGHGGVVVEQDSSHSPDEGDVAVPSRMVTVKTYVPSELNTDVLLGRIDVGIKLVQHLGPVSLLRTRILEEDDWQSAWKEHFDILHVGRHITIVPTWREYQPNELDVVVALDPGMAFGTGHHPTTRMCLQLLEDLVDVGDTILDVGCGSGILSIVAAKLGAKSVFSLDIEKLAAETANSNVKENEVETVVNVSQGSLPYPELRPGAYDLAVANISAKVVSNLAGQLVVLVKPDGYVVVSGILTKDRDTIIERLGDEGAMVIRVEQSDDWVSLVARKEQLPGLAYP